MKLNLSSTAVVCWSEMSNICHNSIANINHSNFKLLQVFLEDPIFEVYQENLGRVFDQAMVASKKLQGVCDATASTAQKIADYCLMHMKPSCISTCSQRQQKKSQYEYEKKRDDEPDLLTLLNASIKNDDEPDLQTLLNSFENK